MGWSLYVPLTELARYCNKSHPRPLLIGTFGMHCCLHSHPSPKATSRGILPLAEAISRLKSEPRFTA